MNNETNNNSDAAAAGGSGIRFMVQPERELEANWGVDLAKKLEDYLLKICSGQVTISENLDNFPVNFAEAALLVQGSVQVYSRKVEYLYNLVLHALEFISQKSQQDQSEGTSVPTEESGSHTVGDEENDSFWGVDDVPVEVKNRLDSPNGKDTSLNHFVMPPANLVVLEGDCLDTIGDGTELESYLLATNDLYRDFILLDPYDAVAVDDFLEGDDVCKGPSGVYRGSTTCKSFQSPTRRSGGTAHNSSLRKSKDANLPASSRVNCGFGVGPDPPVSDNFADSNHGFDMGMDDNYSEPRDFYNSDVEDDPWKPLNPHEPGNLKVKHFRKVKVLRRNGVNSAKRISTSNMFPLAKLYGVISPELTEIWEARHNAFEKQRLSQPPPLYEKLRKSLVNEGGETFDTFSNPDYYDEDKGYDNGGDPDTGQPDFDMPEGMDMDEDVPLQQEKHDDGRALFESNEAFEHGSLGSHANLEDLCRSHLDALLANMAETEKQTQLAARVSSWKQKIEDNLEEQESHPPFDIHEYGEGIINKLSLGDTENVMPFTNVVKGRQKYDVARTFSALLQLVNNGDIDLDRSSKHGESICYTAVNPFLVRLLNHEKKQRETQFQMPKKRVRSPSKKGTSKGVREKSPIVNPSSENGSSVVSLQSSCKISAKLGKLGGVRCTPKTKRRRRSLVDLNSSG